MGYPRTGVAGARLRAHPIRPRTVPPFAIALTLLVSGLLLASGGGAALPGLAPVVGTRAPGPAGAAADAAIQRVVTSPESSPNASVSVTTSPATICGSTWPTCPAGATASRVSLTVALAGGGATPAATNASRRVQVLFLLETTPYDGAYDASASDPGSDSCGLTYGNPLCEESSLDPTFAGYSGTIASALASAHPTYEITFGLIDYFATLTSFDDGDGFAYHVDVGNFTTAASFPASVNATLLNASHSVLTKPSMTLPDSDLSDNILTSSEITALYGALEGAGVNWSASADHVLVLLSSTAPRDPNYPENYCGSPSDYAWYSSNCTSSTCEPSYSFTTGNSPNCEGWVTSQNGNASDSLAALATASPFCGTTPMGRCPIDVINVWDTPTDPHSKGWPSTAKAGVPANDSSHILAAGCDLASATGGSWNGPSFYTCNGTAGTIGYRNYSSSVADPYLLDAIANVSLGPTGAAMATPGDEPFLSLLLGPEVALAPSPAFGAVCTAGSKAPNASCEQAPTVSNVSGVVTIGWNWSVLPFANLLFPGDTWTVSFDVVAAAGARGNVTLFRCAAPACVAAGAGPVDGASSEWVAALVANGSTVLATVPFATLGVVPFPTLGLSLTPSSATGEAPFTTEFSIGVTGGYGTSPAQLLFGDGAQAAGAGPFDHTYATPGTFDAVATVHDSLGQVVTKESSVTVLPTLSASISTSATAGVAPYTPELNASVLGGEAPYVDAWTWSGGSATTSTIAPTFAVGVWNVSLVVTDALGYHTSATVTITVLAAPTNGTPGGGTHSSPPTGGGGTVPSGLASNLWLEVGALVLVLLVVAVAATVLMARRRRSSGRRR